MHDHPPISRSERLLHTFIFETLALCLTVPASVLFTGHGPGEMTITLVGISLMAMAWNYIFNILFDGIFGTNRISRTLAVRILHTASFEIGLLIPTLPFVAWVLEISLWQAFVIDGGAVVFFLFYTLAFNWAYDHLRLLIMRRRAAKTRPQADADSSDTPPGPA